MTPEQEVLELRQRCTAQALELVELRRQLTTLQNATQALVDGLPACDHCPFCATKAYRRGEARYCDLHAPIDCPDYPRAQPLRVVLAMLPARRLKPRLEDF